MFIMKHPLKSWRWWGSSQSGWRPAVCVINIHVTEVDYSGYQIPDNVW